MKIYVDDQHLFTLSEIQKKVIKNDIHEEIFDEDMKRRLQYILMHKYEQSFASMKAEWEPKLAASGAKSIPTNPDEFAQMVFAHPDYKNRTQREPK